MLVRLIEQISEYQVALPGCLVQVPRHPLVTIVDKCSILAVKGAASVKVVVASPIF